MEGEIQQRRTREYTFQSRLGREGMGEFLSKLSDVWMKIDGSSMLYSKNKKLK